MISDLYKADLPSCSERTIRLIPRASNLTPVIEIGGDIDYETSVTDVSIITMTPSSPVSNKAADTHTKISTTKVTRPNTSIS